jgi:hypothetical protein
MDDQTIFAVRRFLVIVFTVVAAVALVVLFFSVRGSDPSKAARLHTVRSVSLSATSCAQWTELSDDVRWISAYRQLSTLRYEARARNQQPEEAKVDRLTASVSELCSTPGSRDVLRSAKDAIDQVVLNDPSLLAN